jgi:phosphate transport system substrate-binding protein
VAGWTCNGIPKNKRQYLDRRSKNADRSIDFDESFSRKDEVNPIVLKHSFSLHDAHINYGKQCEICGLPKEAVLKEEERSFSWKIAAIVGGIVAASTLAIGYLARPQSCSYGQKNVNGNCVAVNSTNSNNSKGDRSLSSQSKPSSETTPTPATSFSPVATLASVPNVPTMKARYGGSTSFAPLRTDLVMSRIGMANPGFDLIYVNPPSGQKPGSTNGIKMLLDGELSFAQSSRPLHQEEYETAENRGFGIEQKAVAIDGLAIYVNSQSSIPGITLSQLKDIYTGKITNWKQLGGKDLKIIPVSRDPKSGGSPEYFIEYILNREAFAPSVQTSVDSTTNSIARVAANPGAIGYATASEICNQNTIKSLAIAKEEGSNFVSPCDGDEINQVAIANDSYPITRRLFVIIKNDNSLDEQAGNAYVNLLLSDEGQQLVEESGLVRIR